MKVTRTNGLAVSAQWARTCRSACLSLSLVLGVACAQAQLFTNLPGLVNQIRDPLLDETFGPGGKFGGPKSIATADFNGDGTNDLAIANTDGSLSIFFGEGSGRFGQLQHLISGTITLRGILAADLNGDGKPDIAVAAPYEGQILIYTNPGSGKFAAPVRLPAWPGARALAAGDYDGDGTIDLIVAGTTNGLRQYRGLGGGAFKAITNLTALGSSISVEDPTKFPKPVYSLKSFRPPGMTNDLLAVTHAATNRVWVVGANMNGALSILSSVANNAKSHSLDVGRVFSTNSSAPLDLVCGERDAGEIEIHQGIGPGLFDPAIGANRFAVTGGPRAVKLVDIDGDGWNDLVVVLEDDNEVLTFRNLNGKLGPEFDHERPVGSSPREIITADFDDDGFPDLAVINRDSQDASTLLAYPHQAGYRGYDHVYIADGDVAGLVVKDFNGDGLDDVIQLHRASGDFSVRLAGTNGLLGPPTFYTIGNLPVSQVVTFVNDDTNSDLVSVNLGTLGLERPSISVRLGNGDGTFGPVTRYELPSSVEGRLFALVAADFDGDGNIDLAVGFLDSRIAFFKGGPDGTLDVIPERIHPFVHSARALLAADFDKDGRMDLAGVGASGELWVVHNTNQLMEAIGFSVQKYPAPTNGFAARTLVAVTNQDGYLDLVAGSGDRAYLYRGGPNLSFSTPIPIEGSSFPISTAVLADFDGNGTQDLVLASRFRDVLSVFTLTNGQYKLTFTMEVPASKFIATGDLDGDGKPDLIGAGNNLLWTALSGSAPTSTAPLVVEGRRPGIPNVVINEILAINSSWPEDLDGGRLVQWVEVYNGWGRAVPLVGWKLRLIAQNTMGVTQTSDFNFPPITFPPGQRLLVYFSTDTNRAYHTGFLLPANGGTLCLINQTNVEIDRVVYPAQRQDVAYARFQDGLPTFVFNPFPSPQRANVTRGRAAPAVTFAGVDAEALRTAQVVRVYVDVQDDLGLADLTLYYQRLDDPNPASPVQSIELYDDGQHGDGGASDGRFAGVIGTEDGLPALSEFQFYFRAVDLSDNEFTLPEDPVFGEPGRPGNVYSLGVGFPAPPVELSEVVARNVTSLHDESGGTPDWVEVRNVSTNSLPMDGIVLSHQIGDGSRYYFPTGTVLLPGQHFVVYCDNRPEQGPLHAPFNLSSEGDDLMLSGSTSDGARTLIDWVSFGSLATDEAFARLGAGGNWRKTTPTPYACNIATSWVGFVETNGAAPVFTFAFPTTTNALYTVQYRATLNSSEDWMTLQTVQGDGIEKVVPRSLARSGFFRVRKVPYP